MHLELAWGEIPVGLESESNEISGLDELQTMDQRFVYIIETPKKYAIKYDNGISNICYIGRQGNRMRGNRLQGHAKGWIAKFLILQQCTDPFVLRYCYPRRRNMIKAYADIEAYLLREFKKKFGRLPLFNRRGESELGEFEVEIGGVLRRRNASVRSYINACKKVEPSALED